MALRGDFAKFHRHVLRVERLGSPEKLKSLTDNLAEEAIDLILDGMARETDPYGKKHAPKVFNDGRAVLTGVSSKLRRGWKRTRSDGKGFRVSPSAVYAKYHQEGTGIYGPKKRKIVPVNAKALRFTALGKTKKGNRTIFRRSVKGCPKRMMVPVKGRLPAEWGQAFIETCNDWFEAQFSR